MAIAYVIARLFRYYQTPQSAQKFFTEECSILFVSPKVKNIIGQRENDQYKKALIND